MSEPGRLKRPVPVRIKPLRTWDGFLGRAPAGGKQPGEGSAPSPDDVLARSVELGYRVVDEYVTRGQEAAQRIRRGTYGASDAAQDVQSVAEQLVRTASDFAGAWVEFFALAGRDVKAAGMSSPPAPPAPPPAAEAASEARPESARDEARAPLRVRLRVDTVRPVEAMLEMFTVVSEPIALVAHHLRVAKGLDRIDGVRVERGSDGGLVIQVTVPIEQPAGRYIGLVLDDTTNVAVGEITIGID